MRVFIAGGTGVIGRPLTEALIEQGHEVTVMTRSDERGASLTRRGARVVVCDVYDRPALDDAVSAAAPDVLVHQLTSLPAAIDPRRIESQLAENDRIRVEGTSNLLHSAERAGVGRVVAQSIAFAYAPQGGWTKSEEAPLWRDAPWPWRRTVEAIARLESAVISTDGVDGVALRYGFFYGPGTAYAANGSMAALVGGRKLPIAGRGGGHFSFVHLDDAVAATIAAIDGPASGIYNVVDDEPAAVAEWLPTYAAALGAPSPWRVPALLARFAAGRYGLHVMTEQRGASNARAKRDLGWRLSYPSWRDGFARALAAERGRRSSVRALEEIGTTGSRSAAPSRGR